MELFKAHRQWLERPPDERFSSLEEMDAACRDYAEKASEASVPFYDLKVKSAKGEIKILGREGIEARLTNWAFGQLALKAHAPADYLRELSPAIAADCINYGLKKNSTNSPLSLLFHNQPRQTLFDEESDLILRALTSEKYKRIWNCEVTDRLFDLLGRGWRVPPARPAFKGQPGTRKATEEDVLKARDFSLSIKVGDLIAPAGLYASAHDMFAFLVNEKVRINDGTNEGLSRGVFFENSEVGDKSLKRTTFLYRHVCGNHIVWDAQDVSELKISHLGKAREKFVDLINELKYYADSSVSQDEEAIKLAKQAKLGTNKEDVLSSLFRKKSLNIPYKQLEQAYEQAEMNRDTDGDPRSVWGMVQGITRLSQETPYTDIRARLDRAAGKVLKIAF